MLLIRIGVLVTGLRETIDGRGSQLQWTTILSLNVFYSEPHTTAYMVELLSTPYIACSATYPAFQNKVLALEWLDNRTLATGGVRNVHFWDLTTKSKRQGLFGRARGVTSQPLLCFAPLHGGGGDSVMVSATASGHLYVWQGRNCVKAIKAHEVRVVTSETMTSVPSYQRYILRHLFFPFPSVICPRLDALSFLFE